MNTYQPKENEILIFDSIKKYNYLVIIHYVYLKLRIVRHDIVIFILGLREVWVAQSDMEIQVYLDNEALAAGGALVRPLHVVVCGGRVRARQVRAQQRRVHAPVAVAALHQAVQGLTLMALSVLLHCYFGNKQLLTEVTFEIFHFSMFLHVYL